MRTGLPIYFLMTLFLGFSAHAAGAETDALRMKTDVLASGPTIALSNLFMDGADVQGTLTIGSGRAVSNVEAVSDLKKAGVDLPIVTGSVCRVWRASPDGLISGVSNRLNAMSLTSGYSLTPLPLDKPVIPVALEIVPEAGKCLVVARYAEWNGEGFETNSGHWELPAIGASENEEEATNSTEEAITLTPLNSSTGDLVYRKGALVVRARARIIRNESDGWALVENVQSGRVLRAKTEPAPLPVSGRQP